MLTGCNEAFIIDTAKRDEILANCESEEERQRTEALIRPILRGKDIKRYSYNWAHLWLINTHNGIRGKLPRIDIQDYPAVKEHLDLYWHQILERKDQGDTPYNLRNCAYLEDFDKPKIIFQEMVQEGQFYYDSTGKFLCNDTCRIIVGNQLPYLTSILNSRLFFYAIKKFYGGGGLGKNGVRMKHTFFQEFPCLLYDDETLLCIANTEDTEKIDQQIFRLYNLSDSEIETILKD